MKLIKKAINYINYLVQNKDGIAIQSSILALMNYSIIKSYKKNYWTPQYGEFDETKDYSEHLISLPLTLHETGSLSGEIMKWARDTKKDNVLFAGDGDVVKMFVKQYFKRITTASFSKDSDFTWDFEQDPPQGMDKYNIIISQACFEHIINPYKHFEDLANMLNPGGYLIIQTDTQFGPYHRYPVDTLRFNPDWFEEMAKRFKLKVIKRRVVKTRIMYMFKYGH